MMFVLAASVIITAILGSIMRANANYVFMHDTDPYRKFGTTTSYELVRSPDFELPEANGCKQIFVWGAIRSGARYYTNYAKAVGHLTELKDQILQNHKEGRGTLDADDLALLSKWKDEAGGKGSDDPAVQGVIESKELGKRLAKQFKDLVAAKAERFMFQSSSTETVKRTARAFIEGMFDQTANIRVLENDFVLRYIENSKDFENLVTDSALKKRQRCVESPPMAALKEDVSKRLGFEKVLHDKSIEDMYYACGFEYAWFPTRKPPFCVAFTKEHHSHLEYCFYDILGYYEWGYGSELTQELHSPVLRSLKTKLNEAAISENPTLKGAFNFTAGSTITHLATKLNLYKNAEHLALDQYVPNTAERWSTDKICPFSANFIAVLYRCGSIHDNKVAVYHNEHLIQIPGCSSKLCPLKEFTDIVRESNGML